MRNAVFGVVVLAMGAAPAVALDGPGRALVASNQIRAQILPATTGGPGGEVERSFIPPYSGTVRLTWEVRSQDGTQVGARAEVSHLSLCPISFTTSTAFVAQTCDVRVAAGMPVNVVAFPSDNNNAVTLRRVQLRYRVVNFDGKPIVWELPNEARPPRR